MTSFDRSHTSSYSSSIVTVALSGMISDTNRDIGSKIGILPRDAMQVRPVLSCGVRLSVRLSIFLSRS